MGLAGVRVGLWGRLPAGLWIVLALACTGEPVREPPQPPSAWPVAVSDLPELTDDSTAADLATAVGRSLDYLAKIPGQREFPLGNRKISAERLRRSLELFGEMLSSGRLDRDQIARRFEFYRVGSTEGGREPGAVLVTGYYEPILKAALEPSEEFRYPLYGLPPDLVLVDLSRFNPERFADERLVGRVVEGRLRPYFSRAEIDGQGALAGGGRELAYLHDPIDAFFLHVQGSGLLETAAGSRFRIGYAGTNGRPYRSVGKVLIDRGEVPADQMSLQAIRDYLGAHPEQRDEILFHNESYVFFRRVPEGPMGSINVPLTAGRSIATDAGVYPRGALGFMITTRPDFDADGQVRRWLPLTRWVVNQDTGGAIKGARRVDLFCGTGTGAEEVAGRLKQPGTLFMVLAREPASETRP